MSRFVPGRDVASIFRAAAYWRDKAIVDKTSLFGSGIVWSDSTLKSLKWYFVEHPDEGEGTFLEKLERQLREAEPAVKQLAAEMTWFMLLCPSNIGADNKRQTVAAIWGWSGEALAASNPWLDDAVLAGIGSAGTAFNTQRWRELIFFIRFIEAFRLLDATTQNALLKDGWALAEWMQSVEGADSRQLRHMILYLLFPDEFERVFGRSDRRKILRGITGRTQALVDGMSPIEIDHALAAIRREAAAKSSSDDLDFYVSPLRDSWRTTADDDEAQTESVPSVVAQVSQNLQHSDVLAAIAQIDREGVPPDAVSKTYDLVFGSRRYPPKYVMSLAIANATGEALSRREFHGGERSQAFKVLRNLGFHIETKVFISELIERFLRQADETQELAVSEYPKDYRGLRVSVSFGKGNLAKIPWISFTGFDQSTSNGIYPVVLYFKQQGLLVVAFGISETTAPISSWKNLGDTTTIASAFQTKGIERPDRYGDSLVGQTFEATGSLDLLAVQTAIDEVIGKYQAQFSEPTETASALVSSASAKVPYTIADATEGLFIEEDKFGRIVELLRRKKNVILQGPPGVGKTYVCKRLAFALMEEMAPSRLQMVQFHQAYSYEDFIQGYRPTGTGFRLKNGIFYDFCEAARNDPGANYVFVIDEINRGNLSKVLGEVMMLIETDKRSPEWAIPLTYSESGSARFYVPENIYVIGLMNTADRSLAMVDYALRRRFAFVDLLPNFESELFWDFLEAKGVDGALIDLIVERMAKLNEAIAEDLTNLGPGYRIGHSFFCDVPATSRPDWSWYTQVIRGEIEPLLREYYFDNSKKAESLVTELLRPS